MSSGNLNDLNRSELNSNGLKISNTDYFQDLV